MHDPMTVAFDIRNPFKKYSTLVTIWHVDPECDGTDDSCGWFMRSRHGDKATLERIIRRFTDDFDRVFRSDSGTTYLCGLFAPNGDPHFTVPGIVLNLFFMAACEHFKSDGHSNWKKARRWMQHNLFDILLFAENPTDSLHDTITRKFAIGCQEPYTPAAREELINRLSQCIYGWILRTERSWWKHPRWHFWHWKIQINPLQSLKRWLFSRCEKCGRRFRYGEAPCTNNWYGTGPLWFRSEKGVHHSNCVEGRNATDQSTPSS